MAREAHPPVPTAPPLLHHWKLVCHALKGIDFMRGSRGQGARPFCTELRTGAKVNMARLGAIQGRDQRGGPGWGKSEARAQPWNWGQIPLCTSPCPSPVLTAENRVLFITHVSWTLSIRGTRRGSHHYPALHPNLQSQRVSICSFFLFLATQKDQE